MGYDKVSSSKQQAKDVKATNIFPDPNSKNSKSKHKRASPTLDFQFRMGIEKMFCTTKIQQNS